MGILEIFLISIGLSMDCFAVSVSFGTTKKLALNDLLRMAVFFGFFQGMMTFFGWWFGSTLKPIIETVDHWIAFAILSGIGIKMILEAFEKEKQKKSINIRSLKVLVSLAIATSIDALMTGVSFGFIHVNIMVAVLLITITAFLVTLIGGKIGAKTTIIPAKRAELFGGIVLILIGLKILLEHLGVL